MVYKNSNSVLSIEQLLITTVLSIKSTYNIKQKFSTRVRYWKQFSFKGARTKSCSGHFGNAISVEVESIEDAVSRSPSGNHRYMHNPRCSPSREHCILYWTLSWWHFPQCPLWHSVGSLLGNHGYMRNQRCLPLFNFFEVVN